MADLSSFVANLLCEATEFQSLTPEKTLSLLLAGQFFSTAVIPLSTAKGLFENCVGEAITTQRFTSLLQTPDVRRICQIRQRGAQQVLAASAVLGEAISVLKTTRDSTIRMTNGTDIEDYGNKNKNPSEADRIARVFNDEFTCLVCMDMLVDAVESSCCKTLCCSKCSAQCPTCPMCRKQNIKWTANEPIRRIVGKKPIKCANNGCGQWSTAAEITIHKEKCEHQMVNCTNRGCTEKMKLSELKVHTATRCKFNFKMCSLCKAQMPHDAKHVTRECVFECGQLLCDNTASAHNDTCVYRQVQCMNKHCKEMVQRRNMSHHLQHTCQYRVITCPNKCRFVGTASRMSSHVDVCTEARLNCKYCNEVYYRRTLDAHQATCHRRPRHRCRDCRAVYWEGEAHGEICPERWVDCPNKNCNRRVHIRDLDEHVDKVCQFTKFCCRNDGCDKTVFRHQISVHEDEQCPFRLEWCNECWGTRPARHNCL